MTSQFHFNILVVPLLGSTMMTINGSLTKTRWMRICHLQEQLLLCTKDLLQGNLLPSPSFWTLHHLREMVLLIKLGAILDFVDFNYITSTQSLRTFSPIGINNTSLYFDAYINFFSLSFLVSFSNHFLVLFEAYFHFLSLHIKIHKIEGFWIFILLH